MVEYLALPGWQTPPVDVLAWVAQLEAACGPTTLDRDSPDMNWVEIPSRGVRGVVLIESGQVAAINFEIEDDQAETVVTQIAAAASALGWELHPDDGEDDDENAETFE